MKALPLPFVAAFLLPGMTVTADPASVLGYLEPYRNIDMNVSEAGTVGEIHVEEGQAVSENEALLSLDNSVLEAQLAIARVQSESESAIIVAQADLDVAKERYDKLYALKGRGTAHSSEVARAEAEMKKAEAQLSIAEEEKRIAALRVEEIQAMIERRVLRSPIEGIVLEINKDLRESATASSASGEVEPVVRVAKIDRLKLVVHVPAHLAERVAVGKTLPVRVLRQDSLTLDRENSAIDTEGTIEFVSPAIDPSSETLRTRLVVENADGRLLSGTHALVLFE